MRLVFVGLLCGFGALSSNRKTGAGGSSHGRGEARLLRAGGGGDFIRDSMLAAMLAKNQIFPSLNLLVVPVDMGGGDGDGGKGFGKPLSYEEEGYVAAPADVSFCVYVLCFCGASGVSSFQYGVFTAFDQLRKKWLIFSPHELLMTSSFREVRSR